MFFSHIINFVLSIANRFLKKDSRLIVFIPHGGVFKDSYSLLNYASDNALTFMKYLIDSYGTAYRYCVAVDYREYGDFIERINNTNNVGITCFPYFLNGVKNGLARRKLHYQNIFRVLCRASYIFTSESCPLYYKTRKQTLVYLGYYTPFKNDYLPINAGANADMNASKSYDYCITTSLLSSQIISHTYSIPLYKFHHLGFPRNDALLINRKNEELEQFIGQSVSYPVRKVILYTPTHRDYEQDTHMDVRSVLGFNVDKEKLSILLRQHNALIICKVHSKQNTEALRKELPVGVVLHIPNSRYGLCELMQRSDYLITDYTSAYFDYLLLDKPVLFNFYDFNKYKECRGFAYDPLDSIIAGDIFTDEKSLYDRLKAVLSGEDKWKLQRNWVKNLVHKYTDTQASKRIYDLIFHYTKDDKEAFGK